MHHIVLQISKSRCNGRLYTPSNGRAAATGRFPARQVIAVYMHTNSAHLWIARDNLIIRVIFDGVTGDINLLIRVARGTENGNTCDRSLKETRNALILLVLVRGNPGCTLAFSTWIHRSYDGDHMTGVTCTFCFFLGSQQLIKFPFVGFLCISSFWECVSSGITV